MNWFKQLFSRRRLYDDLSEEIRQHLEEKIEELVASGMLRKEAAQAKGTHPRRHDLAWLLGPLVRGRAGESIDGESSS
jgi:hypothetical protein